MNRIWVRLQDSVMHSYIVLSRHTDIENRKYFFIDSTTQTIGNVLIIIKVLWEFPAIYPSGEIMLDMCLIKTKIHPKRKGIQTIFIENE